MPAQPGDGKNHTVCEGHAELLSSDQAAARVALIPHWRLEDGKLHRTFHLKEFADSIELVKQIAEVAENANHHPNLSIEDKRRVHIVLWTHKVSALTEADFDVAAAIDQTYRVLAAGSADRPAEQRGAV